MRNSVREVPLEKVAKTFESLDIDKRIAAAKWLEGVIVSQVLTADERERIINASNEYTDTFTEGEFVDKVNALIKYLQDVQELSKSRPSPKCPRKRKPHESLRKNSP